MSCLIQSALVPRSRRSFLRAVFWSAGAIGSARLLAACSAGGSHGEPAATSRFAGIGPLQAPDANGLRLPAGFRSRVVAVSGEPVAGTLNLWHTFPDGGAT